MFTVGNDIVVFDQERQLVVRSRDPIIKAQLAKLPYVQVMSGLEDQVLAALPWCEDSCRMLQNIGIDATGAAPFWHSSIPLVEGKFQPMKHQLFTAAFMTLNPRCYVLNDPRTGKTGSLIMGADYLQRQQYITGGMLVITTVTTMPDVWVQSIKDTLPHTKVLSVHGRKRAQALQEQAEFYVTNYDSCRVDTAAFIEAVKSGRIGGVIIDELTHVGNPGTGRHNAIDKIVNKGNIKHVIGATGSPGENPEVVYGMCRMINRGRLPVTTKKAWMDLVTYQYGPESFMRRMSARAPQIIHEAMQPAVRFSKADVLPNLPPVVTQDRTCAMSSEQKRMRDQFRTQAIALTKSGETITATNGGVLYQKLAQVAQGFCMTNEGGVVHLDYTDRLKTITEAIKETSRKVVIFGTYKASIHRLADDLRKQGFTVGVVDGSITGKARSKVLRDFQYEATPQICICHPTTTAFGTEMSAADTLIFNGPPALGGFIYTQALERLSSAKQSASKISVLRIIGSPEEARFFLALDKGKEMGNFINTLFEDYARGYI